MNGCAASAVREEDNRAGEKEDGEDREGFVYGGLHEAHRRQVKETMVTVP
jgi:hypothetical protein